MHGRNIRGKPRSELSRGLGKQNGNKVGERKAPITQLDLEELLYIVTWWVNERECECLVDTGAVVTLVRKKIIPARDIDVERSEEVRTLMIVANRAIGASTKGKEEVEAKRNPYSKGFFFWGQSCATWTSLRWHVMKLPPIQGYGGCTNTTEGPSTCGFWDTWLDATNALVTRFFLVLSCFLKGHK
ncbi:hypothetical protein JTB14_027653 [Gonioctena quinquepunctata]|nr:hypothetical protein JTB14_027653 [Gonioctena quinquepunctata]